MLLEGIDLLGGHLVLAELEDLLDEHLQNVQVILAEGQIAFASAADIGDEGLPGGVPLVFDYLDEDGVGLRQQTLDVLGQVGVPAQRQHHVHYVHLDALALLSWQGQPAALSPPQKYFDAVLHDD